MNTYIVGLLAAAMLVISIIADWRQPIEEALEEPQKTEAPR